MPWRFVQICIFLGLKTRLLYWYFLSCKFGLYFLLKLVGLPINDIDADTPLEVTWMINMDPSNLIYQYEEKKV